MAELRFSYGKNLDSYRTKSVYSENFDIEIGLENGDIIEVNTRANNKKDSIIGGYAIRLKRQNRERKTLKNIDFKIDIKED